ncbi:MAG: hypothetical protein ACT4PO_02985 [Actinomycetota bacterium]
MERSKPRRRRRGWRRATGVVVLSAGLVVLPALAQAGSAAAKAGWRSPACERDGSPLAAGTVCTPPSAVPQPPPTPLTCDGAVVCMGTYEDLRRAGFDVTGMRAADRAMLAAHPTLLRAPSAAAATTTYSAWLTFYLYNGTNCSGTVSQNGRCGWLYHKYSTILNGIPQPAVTTSAYPARSGNNNPAQEWVVNVGPLPNDFTYKWGFMNGAFTGYEADTSASFSPGKWRLDPWTVSNGSVTRSAFEIHGGTGTHEFSVSGTLGCIRIPSSSVTGLKSMWNNRTSNRKDGASVSIYY